MFIYIIHSICLLGDLAKPFSVNSPSILIPLRSIDFIRELSLVFTNIAAFCLALPRVGNTSAVLSDA